MNFESLSLMVCIFFTAVTIAAGFLYTYFRQSKYRSFQQNSVAEAQGTGAERTTDSADKSKWPLADQVKSGSVSDQRDPVEFCTHIQSQVKQTQHRLAQQKIMSKLTQQQLEEEREIQRRQLADIFRLMEDNKDKFGVSDVTDVQEQMKLYVQ